MDHRFVGREQKTSQAIEAHARVQALLFGCRADGLPPGIRQKRKKLVQAPASVLMQVGVPGRDQRDPQSVCNPKAEDPDIAGPGDVYKIRVKLPHLRRYPILVATKKGVTGQIVVQRKCGGTSFDLHRCERWLICDLCSRPTMQTQERNLPVPGKSGELPAQRSYSVCLAKAV